MATSLACPRLPEHTAVNTQFIFSLTYGVMFYAPLQQAKFKKNPNLYNCNSWVMELHGCIFMPLKVNRKLVSIDLPSRISEFIASDKQNLPSNVLSHGNRATSLASPRLPEHTAVNTQSANSKDFISLPSILSQILFLTIVPLSV